MFMTHPGRYEQNMRHSRTVTASAAKIRTPDGDAIPAAGIFTNGMVDIVIDLDAAKRLALELADIIERHQIEKPVRRDTDTNVEFDQLADR